MPNTLSFSETVNGNAYPGRGIILGRDPKNEYLVSAYFIMGRSQNSRNRVFKKEGDDLVIYPFDESKVEDPSLIIYHPIRTCSDSVIVTNGDQTDTIWESIKASQSDSFINALRTRCFEPDNPNFTPRISGELKYDGSYSLSILKSSDSDGTSCNRFFYEYEGLPGIGHFIHTYMSDGNPLPSFCGEPKSIKISESMDDFTDEIWNALDEDNRISLYVRYTNMSTLKYSERLINKF